MQFNTCRSILKLECKAVVKMINCELQIGTELRRKVVIYNCVSMIINVQLASLYIVPTYTR
jgi:hypothetical protein